MDYFATSDSHYWKDINYYGRCDSGIRAAVYIIISIDNKKVKAVWQ